MPHIDTSADKIDEILTRSVDTIYPSKESLRQRLASGDQLRVYVGIDPTADYVHIGHATNYLLLRRLHQLGHKIIVLVGDFTAMIGDPSDKTSARVQLTPAQVQSNLQTFKDQIGQILNFTDTTNPIEFRFNSEWLGQLTFEQLVDLASNFTVQQMLERDIFERRLKDEKPLFVHEFFYPLMQGYDSVMLDVDLEIGGTDQTFNMLAGRTLMKRLKDKEKFVLTTTLLENPVTGEKLMSKSLGTGISLKEPPVEMYGKVMALPDEAIVQVYIDCTEVPMEAIRALEQTLASGANPRDPKASLAREIVSLYHGKDTALAAEEQWNKQFRDHEQPAEIEEVDVTGAADNLDVLIKAGLASSRSEARRLVDQGGLRLNGAAVTDIDSVKFTTGDTLQAGKRRFVRLRYE